MEGPQIDIPACRQRQNRLLEEAQRLGADLTILVTPEAIQWLTGARLSPLFSPVAAMDAEGRVTLVVPHKRVDVSAAADQIVGYAAQRHSTLRNDQRAASSEALSRAIDCQARKLAVEYSAFGPCLREYFDAPSVDIEPDLFRLRRYKFDDELWLMRRAIEANRVMYDVARSEMEPGIHELQLYNRLQTAAVEELGEPLTYFGQDFQCGSRGGPPRDRTAKSGELYILDLGVGYRGYFSDNARTLAVGDRPTQEQLRAWSAVVEVFDFIESEVRAQTSCRNVFDQVQKMLDRQKPWVFDHHLGHGVGLYPHEAPHLNPFWDDTFEVGDVFTVEPGLYHEDLRAGLRLEQNYRVHSNGVELLTGFDLSL